MKQNKVIGIDWLQFSGIFKFESDLDRCGALNFMNLYITKKDIRTKDFESVYNVQLLDEDTGEMIDFACICTKWNFREKLNKNLQVAKIYNHVFYLYPYYDIVHNLKQIFVCQKIMRIDFYCDFLKFDNIGCENFIQQVASNKILIKGGRQTSVVINRNKYESVTFGTRQTPVRCYLYNKTKELKKSGKEYINSWHALNIKNDKKKDVWRLEFSVLQPANVVIDVFTEQGISFAELNLEESVLFLESYYTTLFKRYFEFTTNETRRKKKDATPVLLDYMQLCLPIKRRKYSHKLVTKTNKIVLKSLYNLNEELRTHRLQELSEEQINYFVKSRHLTRYNEEKNLFEIEQRYDE